MSPSERRERLLEWMRSKQWYRGRPTLRTLEIKEGCPVYGLRDTLAMCRRDLHHLEAEGKVRRSQNCNGPADWRVR